MKKLSKQRLAENEVIFKNINESIKEGAENLFAQSKTEGFPIEFYCECSSERCRERIPLTGSEFERIHKYKSFFIIVCGHDTEEVEKVVEDHGHYCVVEKFIEPPSTTNMQLSPVHDI